MLGFKSLDQRIDQVSKDIQGIYVDIDTRKARIQAELDEVSKAEHSLSQLVGK